MSSNNICLNCEKYGHHYYQCKIPILSVGIIACTKIGETIKYLMIRRKHTLGFVDFIRGKYSIYNKIYVLNLLNQMTMLEKELILKKDFVELWNYLWTKNTKEYNTMEQITSSDKFNALKCGIVHNNDDIYSLNTLVEESDKHTKWTEQEWGFPKGRKNYNEKDLDAALREFTEETGYSSKDLKIIENIIPFEEVFMGSNYKSYKHRYFLMIFKSNIHEDTIHVDNSEVSMIEWKTYDEAVQCIRPYNLEKIRMITYVHKSFEHMKLI